MVTEAERDHVKIINDVGGIQITQNIAREFLSMLPKGRQLAKASWILKNEMAKNTVFKNFRNPDLGLVKSIADITLINYLFPVGSCVKGRFIMQNEEDRHYAMQFLESHNNDKGRWTEDGITKHTDHLTLKYRALRKVKINGSDFKSEISKKSREEIPMEETQNEIVAIITEDEDDSFVSVKKIHKETTLIVIQPDSVAGENFIAEYEIDIDTIGDFEDVLIWVKHLLEKKWTTKEILRDFIKSALEHLKK